MRLINLKFSKGRILRDFEYQVLCLGNYEVVIPIYESVVPILNKHLEFDPENFEYQSMMSVLQTQLGTAYHLAGEYDKSKEAFEKSIPINAKTAR